MTTATLFGAIIGSGLFMLLGRTPAEKLIAVVQDQFKRRQR